MRQTPNRFIFAIALAVCVGCSAESENFTAPVAQNNAASDNPGNDVLSRYCSDCHIAPKAETKTAREWPAIVQRMQTYRSRQAMPVLNDTELNEITAYLIKHSGNQ